MKWSLSLSIETKPVKEGFTSILDARTRNTISRSSTYQRRGIIVDRTMIDKRPKIVEKKRRIWDLEIDIVIGKEHIGALVTVVDRKSKFVLIKKVASKHADVVAKALVEMLEPIKPILKTITSDNGKKFAYHKVVSGTLQTDFYFAHPYHSWERRLNEHTNGLNRLYKSIKGGNHDYTEKVKSQTS